MSFVERHGLWNTQQAQAAQEVEARLAGGSIDVVRFSFPDLHGLLRGKTLVAGAAKGALRSGVGVPSTLLLKDTAHRTVFPVFRATTPGASAEIDLPKVAGITDVMLVADPTTFRVLPWSPRTGWVLCDVYFTDGQPVPYFTREVYRKALAALGAAGFDYLAGLELEFHIFKMADGVMPQDSANPTPVNRGYQLLTELRYDRMDPLLDILRRDLLALDIPLLSLEVELGPSQFELTVNHSIGLAPADTMILLRSAIKQICQRNGYHATFMCRPRIDHVISSGWHLHQSLRDRRTQLNAMVPARGDNLSPVGRHFLAGLLQHAAAATAFSTPTINGFKRYQPNSLAPDRAIWGMDNRGAMVRVVGSAEEGSTHLENRVGEPAANPYLYMASQIHAGMDGMARTLDPGPPADAPYDTPAPMLPKSLPEALAALRANPCFAAAFGKSFISYYTHIKDAELTRFAQEVTEWEQREYFEMF